MTVAPEIAKELRAIASALSEEARTQLRDLPAEHLIALLRTLGLTLRNDFRANKYPSLFYHGHERESDATWSFDSMSRRAVRMLWEHLQNSRPG